MESEALFSVDIIKFSAECRESVLELREYGCGNGIISDHYLRMPLDNGRYFIQGREVTRICGAH